MRLPLKDLTQIRKHLHFAALALDRVQEIAYEAFADGHRGQLLVALQLLGDLRTSADVAWERAVGQQRILEVMP